MAVSTVRGLCADGRLAGAYRREHREWRVPRTALRAYQDAEAERHYARPGPALGRRPRDLGSWRRIAAEADNADS